jgi:hypothetical protein
MFDFAGSIATKANPHDQYGDDTINKVVHVHGAKVPVGPIQMARWGGNPSADAVDTVGARFARLRDAWIREVAFSNSMAEIISSPPYREVASMGPAVVPFILEDLENEPKPWFSVLREITGEDPVPRAASGDMKAMAAAWLDWGKKRGVR